MTVEPDDLDQPRRINGPLKERHADLVWGNWSQCEPDGVSQVSLASSGSSRRGIRMRVVIDGIIYQRQSHSGVSRIYNEILTRMCDLDSTLEITLLAPARPKQPLPSHPRIRQARVWQASSLHFRTAKT